MKKLFLSTATSLLALIIFASPALALTLDTIGSTTTSTGKPTEWWYSGTNPLLGGTTGSSGVVTITVSDTTNSVVADGSGNWTFQPTNLPSGDHTVVFADSAETFTTTMHIGQAYPGASAASGSAQTLPVSGSITQTIALLGIGATIVFLGLKLKPQATVS